MKRILFFGAVCLAVLAMILGFTVYRTIKSAPRLFQLNAGLKAQGYYMAEFEFKMVSAQYLLNEGRYLEAYRTLRLIEEELTTTQGLEKMPATGTLQEQLNFLLDRQDPVTGAFMDSSYPFFTYFAPTCNVVQAMESLRRSAGGPLQLKAPLRFLARIQKPKELRAYLDSLLYLNEMSARLPGPGPYGPGVSEFAYFDILERAGVHQFSEEWKLALRQWFYETQDPLTGFWGARIGGPQEWRQRMDVNSTYHILHLVLDKQGRNQNQKYPLRYAGKLARGILSRMALPIPNDAAEQHDWRLVQAQGAGILTRLLWPHLSELEQKQVRDMFRILQARIFQFYRPDQGGFAYYTSDTRADVDGTGLALAVLQATGFLSGTWERDRLWANLIAVATEPVRWEVHRWEEAKLSLVDTIHSIRVYRDRPPIGDIYDDTGLVQIIYPRVSPVLDVMDLRQRLAGYLASEGQQLGNWTAKESLRDLPLDLGRKVKSIPVSTGELDLARIAGDHPGVERFFVIAFDLVQVPIFHWVFIRKEL